MNLKTHNCIFDKAEVMRSFVRYSTVHRECCLAVFDSNADRYFAPFERGLFAEFLDDRALSEPFFVLKNQIISATAHRLAAAEMATPCKGTAGAGRMNTYIWPRSADSAESGDYSKDLRRGVRGFRRDAKSPPRHDAQ